MIRNAMATALFIGFATIVTSAQNLPTTLTQSNLEIISKSGINSGLSLKDTFQIPSTEDQLFSQTNLFYKLRLDSIQQSIPLNYNEYVQKYIDIYLGRKQHIGKMIGLSKYYFPIFEKSLKEVGIPEEIKFLSIIESTLNPHAVSKSGAVGPWQFMYTTAKGYGLVMDGYVDERKDPVQASHAAALYFKDSYKRLGDWLLAIAAYNCGTGAVSRAVAKFGGNPTFWDIKHLLPKETQNYVPAFIATAYVMNYYMKHEIYPSAPEFNTFTDIIDVERVISLASIAKAADLDLKELSLLNPSYKKQIVNGSTVSPKQLVIPTVDKLAYNSLYNILNSDNNEAAIISANYGIPAEPVNSNRHRVEDLETLLLIANRYGVEVQDLKVWNNLKTENVVPGQYIVVTSGKEVPVTQKTTRKYITYKVRIGDTLTKIAQKFAGATVSAIKAVNGLSSSYVKPGMVLMILKV